MLKGGGDLVHLDQVVNCLGRGFADRLHRSVQAGESLTDQNQSVLFTLHALFSHAGQTRSRRSRGDRARVLTRFVLKYTLRAAHLELGGVEREVRRSGKP